MKALLVVVLVVLFGAGAMAQPAPTRTVSLKAHGGATLTAPGYGEVRRDDGVVVLEQLPDPAQGKTFRVLMVSIEPGPTAAAEALPWDKVRDNIVGAAKKSGRELTLTVGAAFGDAAGFVGRRMAGSLAAPGSAKPVAVELLALVGSSRMVTVGVIAEEIAAADRAVLDEVAKSLKVP